MGSRYEVEVTVGSATNLKNVNWRNGDLRPYAVLWVDDGPKCSTRVDPDNGENPVWDEKVVVPVPPASAARLGDAVLQVDVVHAATGDEVKPLVGSARLPLRDVLRRRRAQGVAHPQAQAALGPPPGPRRGPRRRPRGPAAALLRPQPVPGARRIRLPRPVLRGVAGVRRIRRAARGVPGRLRSRRSCSVRWWWLWLRSQRSCSDGGVRGSCGGVRR